MTGEDVRVNGSLIAGADWRNRSIIGAKRFHEKEKCAVQVREENFDFPPKADEDRVRSSR